MQLSSGSVRNLKPEMVIKSFAAYLGAELDEFALMIHRQEVYADLGSESKRKLISLENLGEEIE